MATWSVRLAEDGAPACEPVRVSALKAYLRLPDDGGEDDVLATLISAGREYAEAFTGRALITQTNILALDWFPSGIGEILLPKSPVQSVDSITYDDGDVDNQGVTVFEELEDTRYQVDLSADPARIVPAYGLFWPTSALSKPASVQIEYTAGYGDSPDAVPANIRMAIMQYAAIRYEQRTPDVTDQQRKSLDCLLYPFRVWGEPI